MNKKKIDLTQKEDIEQLRQFTDILYTIGIKSALTVTNQCADLMDDWCDDCDYHKDDCECRNESRYMREYDDGADYED